MVLIQVSEMNSAVGADTEERGEVIRKGSLRSIDSVASYHSIDSISITIEPESDTIVPM